MTQDNKDAALELAETFGRIDTDEKITDFYNAARSALEEENAYLRTSLSALETRVTCMELNEKHNQRQLLATQEAYQQQREAVVVMAENGYLYHGVEGMDDTQQKLYEAYKANPPSLEAVERKKLEDEIAVLEDYNNRAQWRDITLSTMIAERKTKLEDVK